MTTSSLYLTFTLTTIKYLMYLYVKSFHHSQSSSSAGCYTSVVTASLNGYHLILLKCEKGTSGDCGSLPGSFYPSDFPILWAVTDCLGHTKLRTQCVDTPPTAVSLSLYTCMYHSSGVFNSIGIVGLLQLKFKDELAGGVCGGGGSTAQIADWSPPSNC
jgi:hypothetical protein